MTSEIKLIQYQGFRNVRFYESDADYHYYDAYLNDSKVEVRLGKNENELSWRFLGAKSLDFEWYTICTFEEEKENKENPILSNDINRERQEEQLNIEQFI